jgi:hypothetical protein
VLRFVEMLGGVLVLGRIAAAHVSANEAQAQVDPGVSGFHAILTHVLVCVSELDLVKVVAFFRHRFLLSENHDFKSSHLGHVTKGHNHGEDPLLSPTMFVEVFICVADRLFILRTDRRVHDSGGAAVLGRLGVGWRQWRTHMHYRIQNEPTGLHSRQRFLHRDERDQPARVAQVGSILRSESGQTSALLTGCLDREFTQR